MRNTVLAVAMTACLLLPAGARAQSPAPAPSQDGIFGLSNEQAFAIGAGIVIGALVIHAVLPGGDLTYFVGGVAGGLVANWWYHNGGEPKVRALLKPSASADDESGGSGRPALQLVSSTE